jgi:hypothetical protein
MVWRLGIAQMKRADEEGQVFILYLAIEKIGRCAHYAH